MSYSAVQRTLFSRRNDEDLHFGVGGGLTVLSIDNLVPVKGPGSIRGLGL